MSLFRTLKCTLKRLMSTFRISYFPHFLFVRVNAGGIR